VSAAARILTFVAALGVVFAGATLAGAVLDPHGPSPTSDSGDRGGHQEQAGAGDHAADRPPVRGLAVAEGGLRLVLEDPELRRGDREEIRFRIADSRGRTVQDFDVEHEKRMHLIVARRDLSGFQHLHPEQAADGTWSTPLRLERAGSYRVFADFSHEGEPRTLATDLRVDGRANLEPLPAPRPTAVSDGGYDVRLSAGRVRPGREAGLRFTITKDGVPVRTEPYLGAGGHLVALREGDLAFLHVHPTEVGLGDSVGFAATFPTEGRYRLFLQFKHDGRVQTVAFTQEVSR
jgi:hypothetical protein